MTKNYPNIEIINEAGTYSKSEIIVLLGENGTGKTTFLNMLASVIESDEINAKTIAYKKQRLSNNIKSDITVEQFLIKMIGNLYYDSNFKEDILNELNIASIKDNKLNNLSGGELQRIHLALYFGNYL